MRTSEAHNIAPSSITREARVRKRGAGTTPVTSSRIRDSVCSSVSSIFTVISSVFQVFPAVSKVRRVDSCSRRKKIREMKEEKEEIKRNGGGGKTDIKDSRLAMAKRMGADHTLLVTSEDTQCQVQQVQQIMGCQPDITMECSGTKAGLSLGIYVTKSGGKLVQVGVGAPEVTVPLVHAAVREVDILGVYRYVNCFPIAIDLLAKKLVDVKPLITHRFNFEEFQKAFDMFRSAEDGAIKCMISC